MERFQTDEFDPTHEMIETRFHQIFKEEPKKTMSSKTLKSKFYVQNRSPILQRLLTTDIDFGWRYFVK